MSGRTIIITGASDGIGAAAARALHAQGERVVLVGRSPEKTAAVAAELGGAEHHLADFSELSQVVELAKTLRDHQRIEVLANNAGAMFPGPMRLTTDGFEITMQVNYLAQVLLTRLLLDRLIDSRAKVLQTASMAHLYSVPTLDEIDRPRRLHSANLAYADSKALLMMFTHELDRRFRGSGIQAASLHPGIVNSSFSAGATEGLLGAIFQTPAVRLAITPEQGAETLIWLANTSQPLNGGYYAKRRSAYARPDTRNPKLTAAVWRRTELALGLPLSG